MLGLYSTVADAADNLRAEKRSRRCSEKLFAAQPPWQCWRLDYQVAAQGLWGTRRSPVRVPWLRSGGTWRRDQRPRELRRVREGVCSCGPFRLRPADRSCEGIERPRNSASRVSRRASCRLRRVGHLADEAVGRRRTTVPAATCDHKLARWIAPQSRKPLTRRVDTTNNVTGRSSCSR